MEHAALLSSLGADVREVRLPQEFEGLDGIVLPGKRDVTLVSADPLYALPTC